MTVPSAAAGRSASRVGRQCVTVQPYMLRSISSPGAVKHARQTPLEVDIDVTHAAKVEHQPVVAERPPDDGVAAGPDGDWHPLLAGERERGDDMVGSRTAGHEARPPLDHGFEQRAGLDVLWIAGFEQPAAQPEAQLLLPRPCPVMVMPPPRGRSGTPNAAPSAAASRPSPAAAPGSASAS